jgi:protein-arginine kinase activator protein McsA
MEALVKEEEKLDTKASFDVANGLQVLLSFVELKKELHFKLKEELQCSLCHDMMFKPITATLSFLLSCLLIIGN